MYMMIALFRQPWPWYIAGPLIGLSVPVLLLAGNKKLGVSSSLRDICAACVPANVPFLHYDWKKNSWNLFFVAGILVGGFIAGTLLADPLPVAVSGATVRDLHVLGVGTAGGLMPRELFNWQALGSLKGLILMVGGGFMVGFGTRYAGGCTSGHGIFGLSTLQWPSLVAVCCFFFGGILCTFFILPYVLNL
jgi:uncharacterized membrane protein YedE/YeeE